MAQTISEKWGEHAFRGKQSEESGAESVWNMQGSSRHRDKERYYLLPGMGGRASRRKRKKMIVAGLIVGTLAAGLLVLLLWFMNTHNL